MTANYKDATTAENWETFVKRGDTRVYFTTWNPCTKETPHSSVGRGTFNGKQVPFKTHFVGKEGIVIEHVRNGGFLYVSVQFPGGTIGKYKLMNSKMYSNPKYIDKRNRITLP